MVMAFMVGNLDTELSLKNRKMNNKHHDNEKKDHKMADASTCLLTFLKSSLTWVATYGNQWRNNRWWSRNIRPIYFFNYLLKFPQVLYNYYQQKSENNNHDVFSSSVSTAATKNTNNPQSKNDYLNMKLVKE